MHFLSKKFDDKLYSQKLMKIRDSWLQHCIKDEMWVKDYQNQSENQ